MTKENRRLVLVDDDKGLLKMLTEVLTPSYELHCATNGKDGLNLIESVDPAVVILDLNLGGGMDGFAVCEAMREAAWVHHIPVLFLTAHTDPAFEKDARKAGGDAFMTKPFAFDKLTETIERLRAGKSGPR